MDPIAIVTGSGNGAIVLSGATLIRLPCPQLAPHRTAGTDIAQAGPLASEAVTGHAIPGHALRLSLASASHTVSH